MEFVQKSFIMKITFPTKKYGAYTDNVSNILCAVPVKFIKKVF